MAGAKRLLRRCFDAGRITNRRWYLPPIHNAPARLLFVALFFLAAIGEETGWTGYATEPVLTHWSPLLTGRILAIGYRLSALGPWLTADD